MSTTHVVITDSNWSTRHQSSTTHLGAPDPPGAPDIMWTHAARLGAVFSIALSIIGIMGNLLTIVGLSRNQKLVRHATTVFVINLSISDLIFCAFNLPLTATRYISYNNEWILGDTLCQLYPFLFYGNVGVSLLSMVCITLNRYILIVHNNRYDAIYRRKFVTLMIVFVWFFSFVMLLPPLTRIWGKLGLHPDTNSCTILPGDNGSSPKKFLFILGFAVPCLVIVICYSAIYWLVRQSSRRLRLSSAPRPVRNTSSAGSSMGLSLTQHSHLSASPHILNSSLQQDNNNSSSDSSSNPQVDGGKKTRTKVTQSYYITEAKESVARRKKRTNGGRSSEDMKLTRMMLIIFCTFLLCFLPLTVMNAAVEDNKYPILHILASISAWMSAIVNPFIYALMNRRYRLAYVRLLSPCKTQIIRKWWLSSSAANGSHHGAGRGAVVSGQNRHHQGVDGEGGGNVEYGGNGGQEEGHRGKDGADQHGGVAVGSATGSEHLSGNSTSQTECTRVAETRIG